MGECRELGWTCRVSQWGRNMERVGDDAEKTRFAQSLLVT